MPRKARGCAEAYIGLLHLSGRLNTAGAENNRFPMETGILLAKERNR